MVLRFLAQALLDGGRVVLPLGEAPPVLEDESCDDILRALDSAARAEAPRGVPELRLPPARWGLGRVCRFAQLIVDRRETIETIGEELERECFELAPRGDDPAVVWSVDLCLSRLTEIERQVRGLAAGDPLVGTLRRLGGAWPLSSVGMPDVEVHPAGLVVLERHPALRRHYLDRVLGTQDQSRLDVEWVRRDARVALGAHEQLAPRIAQHLAEESKEQA